MSRHPIIAEDCAAAVALTKPLWEKVAGRRIFVTGGTGFFGRWLLEVLTYAADELAFDCEVVALSRAPEKFRKSVAHLAGHRCVQLQEGDVRTFSFPPGRFDYVAHFGSTAPRSVHDNDPVGFLDLVVEGTRRVLDFSVQSGVQRFLLASTGAVYGPSFAAPVDGVHVADLIPEGRTSGPDVTAAGSANAEAKRVAEFLTCAYGRMNPTLKISIARGFAFVGPYLPRDAGFAACDFLQDALAGGPIRVKGDGLPLRSYLYASDLAVWLWHLWLNAEPGRAWNLGSEYPISIGQLARLAAELTVPARPVLTAGVPALGGPVNCYVPSTATARGELGLRETVPLREALRRTAEWWRDVAAED